MSDFREEVRKRLAHLNLEPIREASIVEEVALHMEDRYRDMVAMGSTAEEADRVVLAELDQGSRLQRGLRELEPPVHWMPSRPALRALGRFPQICGRTYAIALEHFA
jgi:hypothetical protein